MAGSIKIERLQQLIKFKVSQIIQRDLADPRIGLITITKVKLAKDLSEAAVYFSVLGDEQARSRCTHALEHARGFVQREVAKAMKTRTTPHLAFVFDESIEGSVRISATLRDVLSGSQDAEETDVDYDVDVKSDAAEDEVELEDADDVTGDAEESASDGDERRPEDDRGA